MENMKRGEINRRGGESELVRERKKIGRARGGEDTKGN